MTPVAAIDNADPIYKIGDIKISEIIFKDSALFILSAPIATPAIITRRPNFHTGSNQVLKSMLFAFAEYSAFFLDFSHTYFIADINMKIAKPATIKIHRLSTIPVQNISDATPNISNNSTTYVPKNIVPMFSIPLSAPIACIKASTDVYVNAAPPIDDDKYQIPNPKAIIIPKTFNSKEIHLNFLIFIFL